MTQREAWLYLAREFSLSRSARLESSTERPNFGLCFALGCMRDSREIGPVVFERMRLAIIAEVGKRNLKGADEAYMAPVSDAGDKVRVRFCKRMAARR